VKGKKSLPITPSERHMANIERNQMNSGIRILLLPSANGLLGGQMS
jgi:hypothetical protein